MTPRLIRFTLLLAMLPAAHAAPDMVILDWNDSRPPPKDLTVTGYAFGSHNPSTTERQKAAKTTPNQRQYESGTITTPEFVIEHDFIQVNSAGTPHPRLCAISLLVEGKAVRTHQAGTFGFDVKDSKGKKAKIELHDDHANR